jgi:hypothetical protein
MRQNPQDYGITVEPELGDDSYDTDEKDLPF